MIKPLIPVSFEYRPTESARILRLERAVNMLIEENRAIVERLESIIGDNIDRHFSLRTERDPNVIEE